MYELGTGFYESLSERFIPEVECMIMIIEDSDRTSPKPSPRGEDVVQSDKILESFA